MPEPDQNTLSLIAGGDVAPVVQPVDRLPELILPKLEEADFRLVQCERTYSHRGAFMGWSTIPKGTWSRLEPEYASVFKTAKADVISVASNHAMDYGYEPLEDTIDLFQSWGKQVIGGGPNEEAAHRPAIIEANGVKVAILAYCSVVRDGQTAVGEHPGLATIRARTWYEMNDHQPGSPPTVMTEPFEEDVEAMQRDIEAVKADVDAVVMFIHWGLRWIPKVIAPYQPPIAHAAIDAGADIIVGHHPHVPKGIEEYKGKLCLYSVGNFLSTGNLHHNANRAEWNVFWYEPLWDEGSLYGFPEHCKKALLPKITFDKSGVQRVALTPMYINRLAQPEPLTADNPRFQEAVDHLEWVSDQLPHTFDVEGDEIIVKTES